MKISDFGISSQLDSTNGMCSTFVGTTCYMAPERLNGSNYSYGADIWPLSTVKLASWYCHSSAARHPRTDPPGFGLLYTLKRRPRTAKIPTTGCGATVQRLPKA